LQKPELKAVKIVARIEPFSFYKIEISLHYVFEPVAYAILRGKNKQGENGKTSN
jgi:hypothetical protein